ncbi:MAG: type III-A CRISPR-associated RAMP protein Csm5 [Alphaproteobacteria bacterium]|nr:type III-A CRISPR-associated RAMP protein Csm5 [Alphaproteobacteria bacterium]
MTAIRLHAVAVTPVHVGDGSTWTPETFRLEGDELVLFEPSAVLAAMDAAQRKGFTAAIDRGQLHQAQQILHGGVRPEHVHGRVGVSSPSRAEIDKAIADPARAGRVHPFIRSSGRPFLPGSAVKGAMRTAILSTRTQPELGELAPWLANERTDGARTGRLSSRLQARILDLQDGPRATDSDPFRFVAVADAALPDRTTRIDRVFNRRRDGTNNDMQMHFETLRTGTMFAIELAADDDRARRAGERDRAKAPRRPVGLDELLAAVDGFYRGRWNAEAERFFDNRVPPAATDRGGNAMLVRVGRFSHFESASIDGLRRGWNVKARTPMDAGTTRAVTLDGDEAVPFGWILLFRDSAAAAEFARSAVARPIRAASPNITRATTRTPTPLSPSSGRIVQFRKGERVFHPEQGEAVVLADVPYGASRFEVQFDDGESMTFSLAGWTRA